MLATLALIALPAIAPQLDTFEPNDDCASAVASPLDVLSVIEVGTFDATPETDDWFFADVPAGSSLYLDTVPVGFLPNGAVEMEVLDDACGVQLYMGDPVLPIVIPNPGPGPARFRVGYRALGQFIRVFIDHRVVVDTCPGIVADGLEPNGAGAPMPLGAGAQSGLTLTPDDREDAYAVTVPAFHRLTLRGTPRTVGPVSDGLTFIIQVPAGGQFDAENVPVGGVFERTAPSEAVDRVLLLTAGVGEGRCAVYDLEIDFEPLPCARDFPDPFEGGDACGQGPALPLGTTRDLLLNTEDPDAYSVLLGGAGVPSEVTVTVRPVADEGIEFLFGSVGPVCSTQSPLVRQPDGSLVGSFSREGTDPARAEIFVQAIQSGEDVGCAIYDIEVSEAFIPAGTPYCAQSHVAMRAWGSTSIADDDLTVYLVTVAPNPAVFNEVLVVAAASQSASTPTAFGDLCVGGVFRRLPVLGSLTGDSSQVAVRAPLLSGGLASIVVPGSTWYFQSLIRNIPGDRQFTGAVAVTLH